MLDELLVQNHTIYRVIVGSKAFGLATPDSDTDVRGVYLAPTPLFWAFDKPPPHVDDPTSELFSWEVERFCELALKANPNALEVLYSPIVEIITPPGEELRSMRRMFLSQLVRTSQLHEELIRLVPGCITRAHAHHYRGFAFNQWRLFKKSQEIKPLLYTLRVLMTGIHLMRSREIIADLPTLVASRNLPYVSELIDVKVSGERQVLTNVFGSPLQDRIESDIRALHDELDEAQMESDLPDVPSAKTALHDLLVRERLTENSKEA